MRFGTLTRPLSMVPTTDPADPDDWHLVTLARNGDEKAFAVLVERYQHPVYAFIFRYVSNEESARDLAQEVFVRAWFALDRVRPKARFTTWLFKIAINLCRDHVRSRAVRQARMTDSLVKITEEGTRESTLPDPGASPDQDVHSAEIMAAVDREVALLPEKLREAFILGLVEGYPHKEIAAMLGVSAKTVETRIYRARGILAQRLAQTGLIEPS